MKCEVFKQFNIQLTLHLSAEEASALVLLMQNPRSDNELPVEKVVRSEIFTKLQGALKNALGA